MGEMSRGAVLAANAYGQIQNRGRGVCAIVFGIDKLDTLADSMRDWKVIGLSIETESLSGKFGVARTGSVSF